MIKAQEIAFSDKDRAVDVMRDLVEEGYVVMLSAEEQLYIVNYIWSPSGADRNDVTFMSNYDFEDLLFDKDEDEDGYYNDEDNCFEPGKPTIDMFISNP